MIDLKPSSSSLQPVVDESVAPPAASLQLIIERIRKCYDNALDNLDFTNEESHFIEDPLSFGVIRHPVVLSCGHRFSKEQILKHLHEQPDTCPNRCEITGDIRYCPIFHEMTERDIQKLIVNCEECIKENPERAERFLAHARNIQEGENPDCEADLESYRSAFKWTKSSSAYKEVVELYSKMNLNDRAECARIYLAILQLKERKYMDTIETLETCNSTEIHAPLLLLKIFMEKITSAYALSTAQILSNEDARQIYEAIILKEPSYFPAYFALADKIKNWQQRSEIFLRGKAACDPAIATEFDAKISLCKPSLFAISVEEWGNIEARGPWPQELEIFWNALSEEEKGQFIIFPIASQLILDGEEVLSTYRNIEKIAKAKDASCPGIKSIWGPIEIEEQPPEVGEIVWAVMTKTVLEVSRNQTYEQQEIHMRKWREEMAGNAPERQGFLNFTLPTARDALFGLLWHWQASPNHERLYSNNPRTFTRCSDSIHESPLVCGAFTLLGINIDPSFIIAHNCYGAAAIAKFIR